MDLRPECCSSRPQRASKTLLQLMRLALEDKVLVRRILPTYSNFLKLNSCMPQIVLMVAAVVSLSLGLFQDFGQPRPDGEPPVDWVEGVTIRVSIVIVVLVGSLNDWQKEKQF